jgi:hypothetical protein
MNVNFFLKEIFKFTLAAVPMFFSYHNTSRYYSIYEHRYRYISHADMLADFFILFLSPPGGIKAAEVQIRDAPDIRPFLYPVSGRIRILKIAGYPAGCLAKLNR